jgi:DnaJ-class molecular chaperone
VIKLEVPKDFISGEAIIIPGSGAPGINGGPNGDVKVDVVIRPPKINVSSLSGEEMEIFRKYFS